MNIFPENGQSKLMSTSPRTVLHLVHRLTFGGAERVLVNYVNGSRIHHHVVCSFFPPDSFADEIVNPDVQIVCLDKKNGNDPRAPLRLVKICRQYNVDVIHCQGWGTYLEGLICAKLLQRKVKFVFAFHGKTITDLGRMPRRRIIAQKLGAMAGDAVITPSREMRRDYLATFGINEQNISVLYNGIDTALFSPDEQGEAVRQEFAFTKDDIVIGCVARLDPVKNFPGLIKAFANVVSQGMSVKLFIVGDGPEMEKLQGLAAERSLEKKIIFAGRRTDVGQCMGAMDIYVLASFYEGFSMTVLEAMGCGLPVIAYDVGGTHEMVINGRNGILVPAEGEKTDSLTEALVTLAPDAQQRKAMGQEARVLVEEKFSLAAMTNNYDHLFSTV
jgi:sugar transferase (PEP-CTERM/EpsH1 system associated)